MWNQMPWLVATVGLFALTLAVAVATGRRHLLSSAVGLAVLTFLLGLLGLFWGIVHGLHSVHEPDPSRRLNGLMQGVAVGVNSVQAGLLFTVAATIVLVAAELRAALRKRLTSGPSGGTKAG